jgi:hypothetical protein
MQTYEEVAELARICAKQAHFASSRPVARELWRLALEYQQKAAALDSGNLPEIGPAPVCFNG